VFTRINLPSNRAHKSKRWGVLAGLAAAGVIGGYAIGYVLTPTQKSPAPVKLLETASTGHKPVAWYKKQSAPPGMISQPDTPIFPENNLKAPGQETWGRAYEEGLPRETYVAPDANLMKEELVLESYESYFPKEKTSLDAVIKEENRILGRIEAANLNAPVADMPPWRRFALATSISRGKPAIAIVIDDMGVDRRRSNRMVGFQGPLTLSFLTYAKDLKAQGAQARAKGHELMLHVSMEPSSNKVDPGPNVLLVDQKPALILQRLRWGLDRFDGFVGINNHMGSKFTSHVASMEVVIGELKKRGLMFLDSRTSGRTVGAKLARLAGVPYVERNVFLDHDDDVEKIKMQLKTVEKLARQRGRAVAIGHPRDATLKVLEGWLSTVASKGFQLVPISALVRVARRKT
jgi:polysaccharide deacetylase 2 family uncharacterized protein YibQ